MSRDSRICRRALLLLQPQDLSSKQTPVDPQNVRSVGSRERARDVARGRSGSRSCPAQTPQALVPALNGRGAVAGAGESAGSRATLTTSEPLP
jgi:hypothetical protein